jgi:nucleotide-binding universal stress UspA family protein
MKAHREIDGAGGSDVLGRTAGRAAAVDAGSVAYRSIYIPFDNSASARGAVDLGVAIAAKGGGTVMASHVYAAGLHDERFRQMESGLPERYRNDRALAEQRDIHGDLIARGLGLISESFLEVVREACRTAGVPCRGVTLEGKNWQKLVQDVHASESDLVIMGALGLGAVASSVLGSVCERVARRIDCDLLVVKALDADRAGGIVVAIDGSARAFGGLKAALALARIFDRPVEAVAAYDPFFHSVAFRGIAGVLSPAAASVFRFREQERLHEEIIDGGLARIYQAHLEVAAKVAAEEGARLRTTLLSGKAFDQILDYVRSRKPWLLVAGRTGIHSDDALDLGSTAENLLRLADCDVLLSARRFEPALGQVAETSVAWNGEAETRMQRVPEFARGMARRAVIEHALERGHTAVTSDVIDSCLGAMRGPRAADGAADLAIRGGAAKCPFAHPASEGSSAARRPRARRAPDE